MNKKYFSSLALGALFLASSSEIFSTICLKNSVISDRITTIGGKTTTDKGFVYKNLETSGEKYFCFQGISSCTEVTARTSGALQAYISQKSKYCSNATISGISNKNDTDKGDCAQYYVEEHLGLVSGSADVIWPAGK